MLCGIAVHLLLVPLRVEAAEATVDFSRDVRPILSNYCFRCHGPDEKARQGRLRLDEFLGATSKLPNGHRAIVPGQPDASALLARVTAPDPEKAMPPPEITKRPSARDVEVLRSWIAGGARYAKHWAYVAAERPVAPIPSASVWAHNAIDHFILDRLSREGLRPSPEADRLTLLRRAALDLTGLPPSVEEANCFLADRRPDAFDHAVDALLAKPAYGERWAALWLDLARYGDSAGYIHDPPRTIWRFRDWLIQAHNQNLPFDEFTLSALAGDLLPNPTVEQRIATGFHRNTTTNTEGGSLAAEFHFASVVDRVNTTMQVWMGSTFACAQCHNHKYDPFLQKEYYQLFAIFNNTADYNSEGPEVAVPRVGREEEFAALTASQKDAQRLLDEETRRVDALALAWESTVDRAKLPRDVVDALAVAQEKRTQPQREAILAHHRKESPEWSARTAEVTRLRGALDEAGTTTMVLQEVDRRAAYIAIRGDYRAHGERVEPALPAALHPAAQGVKLDRLGFARWIVDPRNPLTARVAVNRFWQELFGSGIVETSEEFGLQGDPPSHPELLDWLATEYVRMGWDSKRFLKLLVTSAAYRQSSAVTGDLPQRDPLNRLLARGPRVRLAAEALRDLSLSVSGLLSAKLYGPPAQPYQPVNGLAAAFGSSTDWETSKGEDRYRRALYTRWRRNLPYPSMLAFDVPERSVCSLRRVRTNTPLQALVTLNDPAFFEAAQALARLVLREGGAATPERATFAFRRVLTRSPAEAELRPLVALYESARAQLARDPAKAVPLATKPIGPLPPGVDAIEAAAWTMVANALLNLDEVLAKR